MPNGEDFHTGPGNTIKTTKKNKCKIIGSSLRYTLSTSNLNQTKAKLIIEQYNTEVNY